MDAFLDSAKPQKINQETNNLNRPITNEEFETIIKCFPNEKKFKARWIHSRVPGIQRSIASPSYTIKKT